jgi:transposase
MRRKIIDAEKSAPEIAKKVVERVRALYAVEHQAINLTAEECLKLRQAQFALLLMELYERLLVWKEQLLPKHPMADAINYALGQWSELNVFSTDGAVPIDNNVSERGMKRIVLNRKNSLSVGNPRGGRTVAILAGQSAAGSRQPTVLLAARPAEDRPCRSTELAAESRTANGIVHGLQIALTNV